MFKDLLKLNKALDSMDVHRKHVVAVMVIDKNLGKILLGKRKSDGIWTGPAGHLQGEESARQCIIREAFEEANLQLKPKDLKDLPSVPLNKGRICYVYMAYVDSKNLDIHVKNDPDAEILRWEWFDIAGKMPMPMNEARIISVNNARMRSLGLKKSILMSEDAGIDINTDSFSNDELASKDSDWVEIFNEVMKDADYGEIPKEILLPNHLVLYVSKIDDGIYSSVLKVEDPMAGDNGEVQCQLVKMTPESMVQALKAKGYLPKGYEENSNSEEKSKDYAGLYSALKDFSGELHIHLEKSKKDYEDLNRLLQSLV